MNVSELIEELGLCDPNTEVRIASVGHRSRFEYGISSVGSLDNEAGVEVAYIGEGSQIGYLPSGVADKLDL
jgi:hypothetical protein